MPGPLPDVKNEDKCPTDLGKAFVETKGHGEHSRITRKHVRHGLIEALVGRRLILTSFADSGGPARDN